MKLTKIHLQKGFCLSTLIYDFLQGERKGFPRGVAWAKQRSATLPTTVTTSPSTIGGVNSEAMVIGDRLEVRCKTPTTGSPRSYRSGSAHASPTPEEHAKIENGNYSCMHLKDRKAIVLGSRQG